MELNASATRSKRTLHDEVSDHLHCASLDAFCTTGGKVGVSSGRRHALIMDEVDGMAGNEDRGGMQVRQRCMYTVHTHATFIYIICTFTYIHVVDTDVLLQNYIHYAYET